MTLNDILIQNDVGELMKMIEILTQTPTWAFWLKCAGRPMEEGHTISSYDVEHGTSIEMCAYGRGGMLGGRSTFSTADLNHDSNVCDYHGGGEKSDKPAAANEGRLQRFEANKANKVSMCNAPFEKELLSGKRQ